MRDKISVFGLIAITLFCAIFPLAKISHLTSYPSNKNCKIVVKSENSLVYNILEPMEQSGGCRMFEIDSFNFLKGSLLPSSNVLNFTNLGILAASIYWAFLYWSKHLKKYLLLAVSSLFLNLLFLTIFSNLFVKLFSTGWQEVVVEISYAGYFGFGLSLLLLLRVLVNYKKL